MLGVLVSSPYLDLSARESLQSRRPGRSARSGPRRRRCTSPGLNVRLGGSSGALHAVTVVGHHQARRPRASSELSLPCCWESRWLVGCLSGLVRQKSFQPCTLLDFKEFSPEMARRSCFLCWGKGGRRGRREPRELSCERERQSHTTHVSMPR